MWNYEMESRIKQSCTSVGTPEEVKCIAFLGQRRDYYFITLVPSLRSCCKFRKLTYEPNTKPSTHQNASSQGSQI